MEEKRIYSMNCEANCDIEGHSGQTVLLFSLWKVVRFHQFYVVLLLLSCALYVCVSIDVLVDGGAGVVQELIF